MSAKRIRVLALTHSVSRQAGGLFTAVMRLCQNVQALGVRTDVYGTRDSNSAGDSTAWAPIRPNTLDIFGPRLLGYAPQLSRTVQREANGNSVIHLHGLWKLTSETSRSVSERKHVPRIVSPHGMLHEWALQWHRSRKKIAMSLYEARSLRSASCIHALCEEEMAQIRDLGFNNPVAIIPNGVDVPSRNGKGLGDPLPPALRGRRILLFLSRLHPKKGLVPLVKAWAQCVPKFPDWALIIVGPDEGGHRAEIENLVSDLRIGNTVRFPGPQHNERKHAWLTRANAFVLPSYSEGLPSAALEAMAYRLPVLLTPQCNLAEAVSSGAAVSAQPTVQGLARGIQKLLSLSDPERAMMGAAGRRLVEKSYTWSRVAEAMISVYQWLLGKHCQPDCVLD